MSGIRFKREDPELLETSTEAGDAVEELEVLDEDHETSETSEAERLELRIRGDLESRGTLGAEAARLAVVLAERVIAQGPDGYEDLLVGAQLVHEVQTDLAADLAASHRELRQLERLMGGFATELRKLDEVLEVLAAYVRRMRGSASADGKQTLH